MTHAVPSITLACWQRFRFGPLELYAMLQHLDAPAADAVAAEIATALHTDPDPAALPHLLQRARNATGHISATRGGTGRVTIPIQPRDHHARTLLTPALRTARWPWIDSYTPLSVMGGPGAVAITTDGHHWRLDCPLYPEAGPVTICAPRPDDEAATAAALDHVRLFGRYGAVAELDQAA